ncbi:flagellar basal-body MS-ring/collar protein FliF [Rhodosalinus sediminis]|uniref:flagellar basal-body MS-ring/collar protein FliF n=1 Tax=Rhodosalinus sediminis TaxID=1940533 RepID=UPI002354094F|nr:flagellar basal-body MS-ring/collar protein FliF [Rhodosalinus sediminis]
MTDTSTPARRGAGAMAARGGGLLAQLRALGRQPALRRALPTVALVFAAAAGVGLYLLASQPAERALAPNLPEAQKSRALDLLGTAGITATLDPATGALMVPADAYHRARMALAADGLAGGAAPAQDGALADMPMGASRSVENARLREVKERSLARSIEEIRAVRRARVHLALPERTAFIRDQEPPRGSVFVDIAPGHALGEAQVQAVANLVSGSVTGMTPQQVSVVDQTGRLLSTPGGDAAALRTDRQTRHVMTLEEVYRNRIRELLTPIVGHDNAAVSVTLDMDFTRSEIRREAFDPDSAVLRSEERSVERSDEPRAGGIPGAIANTPPPAPDLEQADDDAEGGNGDQAEGDAGEAQGAEPPRTTRRSEGYTRNYEIGREVETIQPQIGTIRAVNAAVVLNPPQGGPGAEGGFAPETLEEVRSLVETAVGYDAERGDRVTVTTQAFRTALPADTAAVPWYRTDWAAALARGLGQLAALAVVVLGIVRPLLSRLLPPAPSESLSSPALAGAPGGTRGAVEVAAGESLGEVRRRVGQPLDRDDFDGAISYEEKVALARELATSDSDRIAAAFRTMIASDRDMVR